MTDTLFAPSGIGMIFPFRQTSPPVPIFIIEIVGPLVEDTKEVAMEEILENKFPKLDIE
jgi:hypothetical protein